jgi:hypothetical protein
MYIDNTYPFKNSYITHPISGIVYKVHFEPNRLTLTSTVDGSVFREESIGFALKYFGAAFDSEGNLDYFYSSPRATYIAYKGVTTKIPEVLNFKCIQVAVHEGAIQSGQDEFRLYVVEDNFLNYLSSKDSFENYQSEYTDPSVIGKSIRKIDNVDLKLVFELEIEELYAPETSDPI